MSTRGCGRRRGRGRIGTVTPTPTGTDPVDFMAALGNMAAAMQAIAEALGNQINQDNHGNNNDEDGPMTLATFLKVCPLTFMGISNLTDADNWIQAIERALQAQHVLEEQWVEFETYQLQGAPEDFAEWKCIKYEGGLWSGILSFVAPMEIRVFFELVNKSRVAEDCVRKVTAEKESLRTQGQGGYRRPNTNASKGKRFGKQPQQDLNCQKCEKYHLRVPCRLGLGVCYYCGQPGHIATNCPEKKKYETGRVQQPGRVYTTSTIGADGSETLIRGNCEMAGKILNALFDSGASHSFTAFEKANELGLRMVVLSYDLKLYNATHEAMVTRIGCPQVSFRVQHREFMHDLISLPMTGLDLILGLDWLSKNHVLLDCSEKSVQFMPEGSEAPVVVNSYYLNSMIVNCSETECQGIMLLTAGVSGDDQSLEQIPVVCEFPDVFLDDINEFSHN
ncbi:uncharacterized protein LOC127748522 [Arachis duranensis]|uniref:Uncharacterized protein LOC127748522 n=1 Tax=Arachis duranensis TaxID=130453 RepID=A0A9C6WUF7_ARADU|nr:uncharacterized protein LOC127748522 [Arachis duranensis]